MGRLNYTKQRTLFHCELRHRCGRAGLCGSSLGTPGSPKGGASAEGGRAGEEHRVKGSSAPGQALCSAFSRLSSLPRTLRRVS